MSTKGGSGKRPGSKPARRPESGDGEAGTVAVVMAIYAELESRLPERNCLGRTECCRFRLTGRTPMLTKGEAACLAAGLKASGRTSLPSPVSERDGACPLLSSAGRCLVYAHRPFGCRTHFCAAAGGIVPRPSVIDLIRRLEDVDAVLGGSGPRPLASALQAALGEGGSRPHRRRR